MGTDKFCRLCLKIVTKNSSEEIGEITKQILDTILVKLDFGKSKHLICKDCSLKIRTAFEFKSACFYTDDLIFPYIDEKSSVDLKDIYRGEIEKGKSIAIPEDQKICRLCLEYIIDKFTSLHEVKYDIIHTYIPEINLTATDDPVICNSCLNSLNTYSNFIKDCMERQEKLSKESMLKNGKDTFTNTDENECLQVETSQQQNSSDGKKKRKHKDGKQNMRNPSDVEWYKCDLCEYKAKLLKHLRVHKSAHSEFKKYKCKSCPFTTKYSHYLTYHQIVHKDSSQIKWYECHTCSFKSKHKQSFKVHLLRHRDTSEVQMYNCDKCVFQTKRAYYLKQHKLKHEDETKWYRCSKCDFKSIFNGNVKAHERKHTPNAQLYKCESCEYRTKRQADLKSHSVTHKDASEGQWYRCNRCGYKTRYKINLNRHMLKHKDSSELKIYKCEKCDYRSRWQGCVKNHQIVHKDPSEIRNFECGKCGFKSIYKDSLKKHFSKNKKCGESKCARVPRKRIYDSIDRPVK